MRGVELIYYGEKKLLPKIITEVTNNTALQEFERCFHP